MRRKIPSSTALVIFETAARHENFSLAAKELCLTESAISRRITELERYLDLKLFNRIKKRISLSEAGRIYSEQIRQNLALLEKSYAVPDGLSRHGGST